VIVGVQNFGEVPSTLLISTTYADWKRYLEDTRTAIVNTGSGIWNQERMREKFSSSDGV
jgi:hypothetical protein